MLFGQHGADEEDDQPLDHVREVAREIGGDHVGVKPVGRAEEETAEQERTGGTREARGTRFNSPGLARR